MNFKFGSTSNLTFFAETDRYARENILYKIVNPTWEVK